MRKILVGFLVGFAVLILAYSLQAQVGRGNIYGKVVENEGAPLPGVTLTLTGTMTAPINVTTGAEGLFRFLTLPPANDYKIKAELTGFQTEVIENIEVLFGKNVNLTITLKIGTLHEEITVNAENRFLDKKKTEVGMVAREQILSGIPTPRTIFNIEKLTPGVHSRYWNVGGLSSGQDAGTARGQYDKYMTTYSLDGINISDMSALGSTYGGFTYNNIEEMNVVVGGAADVVHQTSGLSTSIITKRGGNKMSLWLNAYVTDDAFQANNFTDELRKAGVAYMAKVNHIRETSFGLGGPIIKDKAWFYLNLNNDITKLFGTFGEAKNSEGASYTFKLNLQPIPQNRFEFYMTGGITGGTRGDDPTPQNPLGDFNGPMGGRNFNRPFLKFMDEHTIGDKLYLSAQFVRQGGQYSVWYPMIDLERKNLALWNATNQIWEGSKDGTRSARPHYRSQFYVDYFNDNIFGTAHEIRVGGSYTKAGSRNEGGFAGNVLARYNYNTPTVDFNGDGKPDIYPGIQRIDVQRGTYNELWTDYWALFVQDKIEYKNFVFQLGLRYDYQSPYIEGRDVLAVIKDHPAWTKHFTSAAIDAIDKILPATQMEEIRGYSADGKKYVWANLSPRFAFTWDIKGDGRTLAKFAACSYHEWMASGYGSRWARGGTGGWMNFWWLDGNKDGIRDITELYWHTSKTYSLYRAFDNAGNFIGDIKDAAGIMYGSYDPLNPQKTTDPYTLVDGKSGAPRTIELSLSLERQIFRDLALSIGASYRLYDQFSWTLPYYPATGQIESRDWYMSAGKPPDNIPGIGDIKEGKNYEWYVLKPEYGYTAWRFQVPRADYHMNYYGFDFIVNKRMSNRWMFNGSFTLGKQIVRYGDKGLTNPTNKWAVEGREYTTVSTSVVAGGAFSPGRLDNPLWMAKAMAVYQLPWWDIDISLSFNAQEGRDVRETFNIVDNSLPNPRSQSAAIFLVPLGTERSDNIFLLNIGIQKKIMVKDWGRLAFSVDIFNVFNSSSIIWRFPKDYGTYYVQNGVFAPNPGSYYAQDTFAPRVSRIGVRFTF